MRCRRCLKDHKRKERFCRYVGGDCAFTHLSRQDKKILIELMPGRQSEKLDKMNGV
jgi:hypothetical protein